MAYIEPATVEYRRARIALFIAGLVPFMMIYTTQPTMPLFAEEFGVSAPAASLTLSLSTGFLAFTLLAAGSFADFVGLKKIMVASMILTSLMGILSAASPNFYTLLLLRALLGIFVAGVPSIAMAYIGRSFNPLNTTMIMGFYIAGSSIGGMSGRILTGVLTDLFTWRISFALIGTATLILSLVFWRTLPTQQRITGKKPEWSSMWKAYKFHLANKHLNSLFVLGFLLMGSFVSMYNYIGFLLTNPPYSLSQTVIGFIFIVYLFGTFSSIYIGKKANQIGSIPALKLSFVITITGTAFTLFPYLALKLLGLSVFTFGFFASHSIASSLVAENAEKHTAQASSLYLLFYYLGSSIVGSIGGFFWDHFNWTGVILFNLVLLTAGLILVSIRGNLNASSSYRHGYAKNSN
ncbi:MFS transporter [Mesobacillus campisalis]|uniref:MFS transporter n=1 Tax=Mesobacillus campisalis TaxID=1408103 RepID=A0A0M2STJ7_9BACI|nr:MFS transporter [Mesobacillus campisalis]KKK36312.1 MFS transporter [Mesobacillus campisalis]